MFLVRGGYAPQIKILAAIWFLFSFGVTAFYWRKETVGLAAITVASLLGGILYFQLLQVSATAFVLSLLANAIFCASLYAMNLGHWYLNVHGLPIAHLKRASYFLWGLIGLRLVWDVFYGIVGKTMFDGDEIFVRHFLLQPDGIFLLVGIVFGIVLPFIALFMVKEILRLKNTQATTGILYVVLCSVVLADLTFKYYFFKYQILF